MYQLVVLVLNDVSRLEEMVEMWTQAGAKGVTVVHSTGAIRLRGRLRRDDVPLFPSMRDIFEHDELHHRTLFTLTDDEQVIDRLIAATEQLIGNLNRPNTGILFTLPVTRALGLDRVPGEAEEQQH